MEHTQATPEELRKQAADKRKAAEDSFDRCDTDGFLSQWASGLSAEKLELQAKITENGGLWEFPALFDLEGKRVPAKMIMVTDRFRGFGKSKKSLWAIVDPATGKFTGQFVNPSTGGERSKANLRAKGYVEGVEMAPAKADYQGTGTGLSGTCYVVAVRTDRGWC